MALTFEWDPRKDRRNRKKHGVAFDEALTVFADPLGRIMDDPRHSEGERRLTLLGLSGRGRLLAVMFTERGEHRVRIPLAPGAPRVMNAMTMKKPARKHGSAAARIADDDISPEYDFSHARPNPYAKRLAQDTVMVVLDPDVARLFPDATSVNDALRALGRIAERTPPRSRSKRRTA